MSEYDADPFEWDTRLVQQLLYVLSERRDQRRKNLGAQINVLGAYDYDNCQIAFDVMLVHPIFLRCYEKSRHFRKELMPEMVVINGYDKRELALEENLI